MLVESRPANPEKGWVPMHLFEMRVDGHPGPVGQLHLRVGDTHDLRRYAGHIGYAVEEPWRGRRFAARALRLVLPFASRCGVDPLWITCNPDNIASVRTLEIAGAERVGVVDLPPESDMYQAGERSKVRYRLPSSEPPPAVAD